MEWYYWVLLISTVSIGLLLLLYLVKRYFNIKFPGPLLDLINFSITPEQLSQNVKFGRKGEDFVAAKFKSHGLHTNNVGKDTNGLGDLNIATSQMRLRTNENSTLPGKEWLIEVKTVQEWEKGGKVRRRGRIQISKQAHQNLLLQANKRGAVPTYIVNFVPDSAIRNSSDGKGWSKWGNKYVYLDDIETYQLKTSQVSGKITEGKGRNVLIGYKSVRYPVIIKEINQKYKAGKITKIERDKKLAKLDAMTVKSEKLNIKQI